MSRAYRSYSAPRATRSPWPSRPTRAASVAAPWIPSSTPRGPLRGAPTGSVRCDARVVGELAHRASDGRVENLAALELGRRAVNEDEELFVGLVDALERRAGLDVDDASLADLVAFRRIAEVHRQRAADDHERLLLDGLSVAASFRAGLVAPKGSRESARGPRARSARRRGAGPRRARTDVSPTGGRRAE